MNKTDFFANSWIFGAVGIAEILEMVARIGYDDIELVANRINRFEGVRKADR